ncbi:peptidoglycan DD-metalloendopeptidase family protein [Bartonella sp. B41]
MYLKVLGSVFRRNFCEISFLAITVVLVGCGSGTERFSGIFSNHAVSNWENTSATISAGSQISPYSGNGTIQSTELPPIESSNDSLDHNNVPYSSPRYGVDSSSNKRIMGAPPRRLGTLSRSQINASSVFHRNSYVVQSGDTLSSISQQIGVNVDTLKLANGINDNSIYIGQILTIPTHHAAEYSSVQKNNLVSSKTKPSFQSSVTSSVQHKKITPVYKEPVITTHSTRIDKLDAEQKFLKSKKRVPSNHESRLGTDRNTDNAITPQATGISKMRWPVRGRLLSQFGQKKGTAVNRGIDIAAPEGSSVKAAENGIVIYASDGLKELGNVVMIRHEDNIITIYGYNSQIVVNKGQRVRRGDEIAKSGISGNVKTPRVYFEIRKNSVPVSPIEYLEN